MHNEQVFTPEHVVNKMLDGIGYNSGIRKKHIIDNSCGDGAFLKCIVIRYIVEGYREMLSVREIISELEEYIHGIEIDRETYEKCLETLHETIRKRFGDDVKVKFDIRCCDALETNDFDGKMNYVVGNPPYCKVHDFKENYEKYKKFNFCQDSNTDLYLAFFEKGIQMMAPNNAILSYITPNSWFTSKAGLNMRKYLIENGLIHNIINFGSERIFEDATTFTCITMLDNIFNYHKDRFGYREGFDNEMRIMQYKTSVIDGNLYFADEETLKNVENMLLNDTIHHKIYVKNGFATLNDKLFINVLDNDKDNTTENYIPMVKASTGKQCMGVFPYNKKGKPLEFEELDEKTKDYLLEKATILDIDLHDDKKWWLYGRTQAINDVHKKKFTVSQLIKGKDSIKITEAPEGTGVYGGLYIVSDEIDLTNEKLEEILKTDEFIDYVKVVGMNKNGGYMYINSKNLQKFINFSLI